MFVLTLTLPYSKNFVGDLLEIMNCKNGRPEDRVERGNNMQCR
jgi:hypothetical protein